MGKTTEKETVEEAVEETIEEQPNLEAEASAQLNVNKEPASPGLTIQDLTTIMQIIAVVQARGAIKADEMVVVGGLYTKLNDFLQAAGAVAEQGENKI